MKVERKIEIKTEYNFEAPVYNAAVSFGIADKETKLSSLDLNKLLVKDKKNTYLVKVIGESMIGKNINEGDLLVVARDEEPKDGKIVIASLNGEMAVKIFRVIDEKVYLYSANQKFLPIEIKPFWNFEIQGVVKFVIKDF